MYLRPPFHYTCDVTSLSVTSSFYLWRHLSICDNYLYTCDVTSLSVTSSFYLWQLPIYTCDVTSLSVTSHFYLWRHLYICDVTSVLVTKHLSHWRNISTSVFANLPESGYHMASYVIFFLWRKRLQYWCHVSNSYVIFLPVNGGGGAVRSVLIQGRVPYAMFPVQ